jgi:hypothetical protein
LKENLDLLSYGKGFLNWIKNILKFHIESHYIDYLKRVKVSNFVRSPQSLINLSKPTRITRRKVGRGRRAKIESTTTTYTPIAPYRLKGILPQEAKLLKTLYKHLWDE